MDRCELLWGGVNVSTLERIEGWEFVTQGQTDCTARVKTVVDMESIIFTIGFFHKIGWNG